MKHTIWRTLTSATTLAALTALAVACRAEVDEAVDAPTDEATPPMRLAYRLVSSSDYDTLMPPPVFMFWEAASLLRTSDTVAPQPDLFFVTSPSDPAWAYSPSGDKIETDRETWYDTGHPYLNDDETVLASGFFPLSAARTDTAADGTVASDYTQLVLPPDMLGRDSLWIAREPVLGSSYNPFSQALCFVHATTRLVLKGQLAQGMSLPVHHVKVTLHASDVLYRMQWHSYETTAQLRQSGFEVVDYDAAVDSARLSAADSAALAARLTYTNRAYMPSYLVATMDTSAREPLGTFYLRPELTGLRIDVEAQMGTSNQLYEVLNWPITFADEAGNAIKLHSGDSYELILKFNMLSIELTGRKQDFQDGGNAYVTLKPYQ